GFDMDFHDPVTNEMVSWSPVTPEIVAKIKNARWKVVDVETTGLTPHSAPINLSGKEIRSGCDATLRLRVNSVLIPCGVNGIEVLGFDFDKLSAHEKFLICEAAHTGVMFGHNVGFDAYWIQALAKGKLPDMLLDSMLIARALR